MHYLILTCKIHLCFQWQWSNWSTWVQGNPKTEAAFSSTPNMDTVQSTFFHFSKVTNNDNLHFLTIYVQCRHKCRSMILLLYLDVPLSWFISILVLISVNFLSNPSRLTITYHVQCKSYIINGFVNTWLQYIFWGYVVQNTSYNVYKCTALQLHDHILC